LIHTKKKQEDANIENTPIAVTEIENTTKKKHEDANIESTPIAVTEIENTTNITQTNEREECENSTLTLTNVKKNRNDEIITKQSFQLQPLRTYLDHRNYILMKRKIVWSGYT